MQIGESNEIKHSVGSLLDCITSDIGFRMVKLVFPMAN